MTAGNRELTFDDVLTHIGEFGKYQKILFGFIVLPAMFTAFSTMSVVFIMGNHDHRCSSTSFKNDTFIYPDGIQKHTANRSTITEEYVSYLECTIDVNISFYVHGDIENHTITKRRCTSWIYDDSIYKTTLISEFDLVCDRVMLQSHAFMANFGGSLFASFFISPLADIYGRKPVVCIALILMCATGLAIVWIPSYLGYVVLRFIYGIMDCTYWSIATVVCLESVGPSKRKLAGVMMDIMWCFGQFILCGLAFWLREWRDLQLAISLPMVIFILHCIFLEESPRWLFARGKEKEALKIIFKISKYNQREICADDINALTIHEAKVAKIPLRQIYRIFLRSPKLSFRTCVVALNLFVIFLGYYGISVLLIGKLGGNIYVDFFASAVVELFAYILCYLLLDITGRRPFHCISMIIGGISCLCSIFTLGAIGNAPAWTTTTLSMIGKLGLSASFVSIFIIASEVTPTPLRSFVNGIGRGSGLLGSIAAPYVVKMGYLIGGSFEVAYPLVKFGVLMIVAGLLALLFPETLNKHLPDSTTEAKDLFIKTSDIKDQVKKSIERDQRDGREEDTLVNKQNIL